MIVSDTARSDIVIWDIRGNKLQTRIPGRSNFGIAPQVELRWSPDGRSITIGSGASDLPLPVWDPLTGAVQKELAVDRQCRWARYNRDGSRLLLSTATFQTQGYSAGFRVYDTQSWNFKDFDGGGLFIETQAWTADDEVLVAGAWPWRQADPNHTLNGLSPKPMDIVARLIDPTGHRPPQSAIIAPSVPTGVAGAPYARTFWIDEAVTDYPGDRVSLQIGSILDVKTLKNWRYASDDDIRAGKVPGMSQAFSPDGRYLYLIDDVRFGRGRTAQNAVLDSYSGSIVGRFDGGHSGLAVSPDKQHIAVGNGYASVAIFKVQ
nr:WD40 repeat domain-containing protein [uncultured Rhodopila sp.]